MSKLAMSGWVAVIALPSDREPCGSVPTIPVPLIRAEQLITTAHLPNPAAVANAPRPVSRVRTSLLQRLLARLLRWQQRATMRHDLRQMPDWLLRDIGITRHAALAERRSAGRGRQA